MQEINMKIAPKIKAARDYLQISSPTICHSFSEPCTFESVFIYKNHNNISCSKKATILLQSRKDFV